MLAAIINVPAGIGYPLLFLLVAGESAGALVPGESSLIVAAALAAQGRLSLLVVIAVAASAAILGDNTGYLIGRRGLRRLLERPGRRAASRRRLVERGEKFFARRGAAAVFFARWLPGLRVVTSWLAGADRMPWRRFLLWNALGGIAWATTIGGLAYLLGRRGGGALGAIGFVGLALAGLVYLLAHVRRLTAAGRSERLASLAGGPAQLQSARRRPAQRSGAMRTEPPTRRERAETEAAIQFYTANAPTRGAAIESACLTEGEARRLVELTRRGDRSTRNWWPLVLRATGIKSRVRKYSS